jgi:hypothetical protein
VWIKLRRIAIEAAFWASLAFVLKWLWKLLENAALGWADDRIGEWIGPMIPPFANGVSIAVRWGPPVLSATAIVLLYHHINRIWLRRDAAKTATASITGATAGVGGEQSRHRKPVRLRSTFRLFTRRFWRAIRLYVPWEYEVHVCLVASKRQFFSSLSDDRQAFLFRFADAFPGIGRTILSLRSPSDIIRRLNVLLRWPLMAGVPDAEEITRPFYWISDNGNMHLQRYFQYKHNIVLINDHEARPRFLAAISGGVYWQNFVYLECDAAPPQAVPGEQTYSGSKEQAFAIYNGRIVTYGEYADGSYIRRRRPIRFRHKPDLRVRNLRPVGYLIIPHSSSVNDPKYDRDVAKHIQRVIDDKSKIEEFAEFLLSLPKTKRS